MAKSEATNSYLSYDLSAEVIDNIKSVLIERIPTAFGDEAVKAYLYGSCARGDFGPDSDIDIAVLFDCDRAEAQSYMSEAARLSTDIAMNAMQVVNFACLPYDEFNDKKEWYPFYANIVKDGILIYER